MARPDHSQGATGAAPHLADRPANLNDSWPKRNRKSTKPFRGHHTAGQRLVLVLNCLIVVLCFAGAVGLLIGKNAGEKGRKVADQHAVEQSSALRAANSLLSPPHRARRCPTTPAPPTRSQRPTRRR